MHEEDQEDLHSDSITHSQEKPQILLIVGCHRAGTSLLTGILSLLGVSLSAQDEQLEQYVDNPMGYFESRYLVHLHDQVLLALNRRWYDVESLHADPLPINWHKMDSLVPWRFWIKEVLRYELRAMERPSPKGLRATLSLPTNYSSAAAGATVPTAVATTTARPHATPAFWGFKDPRATRLIPLWKSLLGDMGLHGRFVVALRRPQSVVQSLLKRHSKLNGMTSMDSPMAWPAAWPAQYCTLLWLEHYAYIVRHLKESEVAAIIDYDAWFDKKSNSESSSSSSSSRAVHQAQQLIRGLNLPPQSNAKVSELVSTLLSAELRHHSSSDPHSTAKQQFFMAQDLAERLYVHLSTNNWHKARLVVQEFDRYNAFRHEMSALARSSGMASGNSPNSPNNRLASSVILASAFE